MTSRVPRRIIRAGVERLPRSHDVPRHQHPQAYVTAVLSGAYEQAAYAGRMSIQAGDLILQPTFDCHADHMLSRHVEILRLPWAQELGLGGVFADCPVEEIRRAAECSIADARSLVSELLSSRTARRRNLDRLCDRLAADFVVDTGLSIGAWADQHGRSREGLAREFRSFFGVSPSRFRFELRARGAWRTIVASALPLSSVAHDLGFADQAHMTRAVGWLTGASPSAWRRPGGPKAAG